MAVSIVEHLQREWVVVWENPSPTSSFAAQTLQLDLSDYAFVRIEFSLTSSNDTYGYIEIPVEEYTSSDTPSEYLGYTDEKLSMMFGTPFYTAGGTTGPFLYTRVIDAKNSGITFTTCYRKRTSSTDAATEQAGNMIPNRILAR